MRTHSAKISMNFRSISVGTAARRLPASGTGVDFPGAGGCCALLASGHGSRRFDHLVAHSALIKPLMPFQWEGRVKMSQN